MQREPKQPRRVRVERGVYRSPSTGGYEIQYTDSSGRVHPRTGSDGQQIFISGCKHNCVPRITVSVLGRGLIRLRPALALYCVSRALRSNVSANGDAPTVRSGDVVPWNARDAIITCAHGPLFTPPKAART